MFGRGQEHDGCEVGSENKERKKQNCEFFSGARIRREVNGRCYSVAYLQAKHTCCCSCWVKLTLHEVEPSKITRYNTTLTDQSAILFKEH